MSFEPLSYPAHCFLLPIMPSILGLVEKQTVGKWILPILTIHSTRCYSQNPAWAPPSVASCYPPTRLWGPLKDILKLSRVHPKVSAFNQFGSTRQVWKLGLLLNIRCGVMLGRPCMLGACVRDSRRGNTC